MDLVIFHKHVFHVQFGLHQLSLSLALFESIPLFAIAELDIALRFERDDLADIAPWWNSGTWSSIGGLVSFVLVCKPYLIFKGSFDRLCGFWWLSVALLGLWRRPLAAFGGFGWLSLAFGGFCLLFVASGGFGRLLVASMSQGWKEGGREGRKEGGKHRCFCWLLMACCS